MVEGMVFFDFDNTLTPWDVLDDLIERFSVNQEWVEFEKAWKAGKIGSQECLEGQLQSVRISRSALSEYLASVRLDPHFKKLIALLKRLGMEYVIVSDSFTPIIEEILHKNRIQGVKVYANELEFRGERLTPSFPYESPDCSRCAHCKKKHLLENKDKKTVYVGDGLSDVCPARHADLVFAKGILLDYLRKSRIPCIQFKDLGDVHAFFEERGQANGKSKKALAIA